MLLSDVIICSCGNTETVANCIDFWSYETKSLDSSTPSSYYKNTMLILFMARIFDALIPMFSVGRIGQNSSSLDISLDIFKEKLKMLVYQMCTCSLGKFAWYKLPYYYYHYNSSKFSGRKTELLHPPLAVKNENSHFSVHFP